MQKIQYAANSYYNRGLEMAKERNLSGAARFLKRALQFNKYHTDARNLLGLIFYEMGETSDALIQWVISINLQPDNFFFVELRQFHQRSRVRLNSFISKKIVVKAL